MWVGVAWGGVSWVVVRGELGGVRRAESSVCVCGVRRGELAGVVRGGLGGVRRDESCDVRSFECGREMGRETARAGA